MVFTLPCSQKMTSSSLHQVHVDEEKIEGADQEEVDVEEVEMVWLDSVGENLSKGQSKTKDDKELCIESRNCSLKGVTACEDVAEVPQKSRLEVGGRGDVRIVEHLERGWSKRQPIVIQWGCKLMIRRAGKSIALVREQSGLGDP